MSTLKNSAEISEEIALNASRIPTNGKPKIYADPPENRIAQILEPDAPLPGCQTVADETYRRGGGNRHEISNLMAIDECPTDRALPPRIAAVKAKLDSARDALRLVEEEAARELRACVNFENLRDLQLPGKQREIADAQFRIAKAEAELAGMARELKTQRAMLSENISLEKRQLGELQDQLAGLQAEVEKLKNDYAVPE